jgi:DNA polymerase III epsilon subunit-like protein
MTKYYCCIDIEGSGNHQKNSRIVAIGATVIKVDQIPDKFTDPEFLEDFMVSLETKESEYEEACLTEFWAKYPELKQKLEAEAIDRKVGLQKFVDWLSNMRNKYQPLILVSDNKTYDLSRISYELDIFLGEYPCTFYKSKKGRYNLAADLDLSDWISGVFCGMNLELTKLGKSDMKNILYKTYDKEINFKYAHTHHPLDDTKSNAEVFWAILIHLKRLKIQK